MTKKITKDILKLAREVAEKGSDDFCFRKALAKNIVSSGDYEYEVLEPLTLGFGSHTRQLSPSNYKTYKRGEVLTLDSESRNGNVWFIDKDGDRGKIESGSVQNLVRRGMVKLLPPVYKADPMNVSAEDLEDVKKLICDIKLPYGFTKKKLSCSTPGQTFVHHRPTSFAVSQRFESTDGYAGDVEVMAYNGVVGVYHTVYLSIGNHVDVSGQVRYDFGRFKLSTFKLAMDKALAEFIRRSKPYFETV
jgi:hypothetical protein